MMARLRAALLWWKRGSTLLLALALLSCAGCGQRPAASSAGPVPPASSAGPGTEAPAEPEPPDAVSRLTALSPSEYPSLGALDGGLALVCWAEYGEEGADGVTHCAILDPAKDRVVRSATLSGALALNRVFADGSALLYNYQREQFYLLDGQLRATPMEVPAPGGQFSSDHSRYFYVSDETLYVYDLTDGTQSPVELAQGLRLGGIGGIHPTEDALIGWIYHSLYSLESCSAMIDCDSGQLLLLQPGMGVPYFYGGGADFQCRFYDSETGVSTLAWGPLRGETPLRCVDLAALEDDYTAYQCLPDSNYGLQIRDTAWTAEEEGVPAADRRSTTLYRLDTEGLSRCPLAEYGFQDVLAQAIYLPESECVLGYRYQEGAGGGTRPHLSPRPGVYRRRAPLCRAAPAH